MKPLNKYFDHTLLSPLATEAQIIRLCKEANGGPESAKEDC